MHSEHTRDWFPAWFRKVATELSVRWAKRLLLAKRDRSHAGRAEIRNIGVEEWGTNSPAFTPNQINGKRIKGV